MRSGLVERAVMAIAPDLPSRGGLELRRRLIDGRSVPVKGLGAAWEIMTPNFGSVGMLDIKETGMRDQQSRLV